MTQRDTTGVAQHTSGDDFISAYIRWTFPPTGVHGITSLVARLGWFQSFFCTVSRICFSVDLIAVVFYTLYTYTLHSFFSREREDEELVGRSGYLEFFSFYYLVDMALHDFLSLIWGEGMRGRRESERDLVDEMNCIGLSYDVMTRRIVEHDICSALLVTHCQHKQSVRGPAWALQWTYLHFSILDTWLDVSGEKLFFRDGLTNWQITFNVDKVANQRAIFWRCISASQIGKLLPTITVSHQIYNKISLPRHSSSLLSFFLGRSPTNTSLTCRSKPNFQTHRPQIGI